MKVFSSKSQNIHDIKTQIPPKVIHQMMELINIVDMSEKLSKLWTKISKIEKWHGNAQSTNLRFVKEKNEISNIFAYLTL